MRPNSESTLDNIREAGNEIASISAMIIKENDSTTDNEQICSLCPDDAVDALWDMKADEDNITNGKYQEHTPKDLSAKQGSMMMRKGEYNH